MPVIGFFPVAEESHRQTVGRVFGSQIWHGDDLASRETRVMAKRIVIALVLSVPVAVLVSIDLGLLVGGGETGGTVSLWAFLVAWVALTIFAARHTESRRIVARTAIAYAVAAFALPVATLVFTFVVGASAVSDSPSEAEQVGAIIGTGLAGTALAIIAAVFGFFTGIIAVVIGYFFSKPPGAPAA